MKHIKEKDLILFFYDEIAEKKKKEISLHIKDCAQCSQRYENLKQFLKEVKTKVPQVSSVDIDKIVVNAVESVAKERMPLKFKQGLNDFCEKIGFFTRKYFLRPQLALIVMTVLAFIIYPLRVDNKFSLEEEFNLLEIEMELSLEDDSSIVDIYSYDETQDIIEDEDLLYSTLHKMTGQARIKT